MKCETCAHSAMCYLHRKYSDLVSLVALLNGTNGPAFPAACAEAAKLYDGCIHYEAKR